MNKLAKITKLTDAQLKRYSYIEKNILGDITGSDYKFRVIDVIDDTIPYIVCEVVGVDLFKDMFFYVSLDGDYDIFLNYLFVDDVISVRRGTIDTVSIVTKHNKLTSIYSSDVYTTLNNDNKKIKKYDNGIDTYPSKQCKYYFVYIDNAYVEIINPTTKL